MSMSFPAIQFQQRRTRMYIATVSLNDLDRFSIDIWDPKNVLGRHGYQRTPDEARIKKIAKYFEKKDAIMPVAGLLNVRDKGRIKFKKGFLTIPDGVKVWVVDMQHRLKGLVAAKEHGVLSSENFLFPVVITEGLDQVGEATQFYVVNTRTKKMDVALTRRLLIENNMIKDVSDVKPWEIDAVRTTIQLNEKIVDNPWLGALRRPNEEKLERHVATEKIFVYSLRQLMMSDSRENSDRMANRLAKFWSAIRSNIPDAFIEPKRYLIQKTHGIFAFNFFIAPAFLRKYKDSEFINKLGGLKKMGASFWKSTNKRGAKRFGTGMGGQSNLAAFLRQYVK